jgi:hypothetical protein
MLANLEVVSNFRSFIHNLNENGVDMSHVSISRSYAILVGLEAYVKTRRKGKHFLQKFSIHKDKPLAPDELAKRDDEAKNENESAEKERQYLESKVREEREDKENMKLLLKRRQREDERGGVGETEDSEKEPDIQAPGTKPENAIPEVTRNI